MATETKKAETPPAPLSPAQQKKLDDMKAAQAVDEARKKAAAAKAPLDTATTDRSPGKQGLYGEIPK